MPLLEWYHMPLKYVHAAAAALEDRIFD